jgi:polyphosphate glucokinase
MGGPTTLAIDIGGTGLKASVLGADGALLHDRVRVLTTYPLPPERMIAMLRELVAPLGSVDRVSVAFPGVVRHNHVLTAPAFVTRAGLGTPVDPKLVQQWSGFDLGGAIARTLYRPTRVLNDADVQGLAVVRGAGVEVTITLGTGFGSSFFLDGRLGVHFELAHHVFRKGETYNEQLGDVARKDVGKARWNRRVERAIASLRTLVLFDRLYVGGGNSKHVTIALPHDVTLIDPNAGIRGGLELWSGPAAADFVTAEPPPRVPWSQRAAGQPPGGSS